MLTLPPALQPYRGLLIAAVALIVLLLVFPASRRALRNLREQTSGYIDGLMLSNRPLKAAISAVARKIGGLQRSVETRCKTWMVAYHEQSTKRILRFNIAERTHADALEELARAEAEAQRDAANGIMDTSTASRSPFSLQVYYGLQIVIGIGDIVFTYFAFELWQLPTILLVPLVLMLGGIGVVLGHFCGQAITKGHRGTAVATGIGCVVQCLILGSTRFAYLLSQQGTVSNVDTISAIAAFGIPFLLVFTSVVLGAQVRYPTPLEKARAWESAIQKVCDTTYARGKIAAEKLTAKMEARKSRMLEIIDAYYRGFHFGWRNEPADFPEPVITIPTAEWPPPAIPARPGPKRAASGSGAPSAGPGAAP